MAIGRDKRSIESLDDIYLEAMKPPETAVGDQETAPLSEDFLGGDVYSADHQTDDSYGQVVMHGLAVNDPAWHGKEIAIAADKMRVTIKVNGGKAISSYQLNHGLDQLGVSYGVNWQALVEVEELSSQGKRGEVVVARGTAAKPKCAVTFPDIERGIAVDGSFFWLADGIKLNGNRLRDLLGCKDLENDKAALLVKAVAVGTVLAKIYQNPEAQPGTNVFGETIEPIDDILPEQGDNVRFNPKSGALEATIYGYLAPEDNTLSVLPPIWIPPDGLSAYYANATQIGHTVLPSVSDLRQALRSLSVTDRVIRQGIIDKLVERLLAGQSLSVRTVKIAEAIAPKPGRNAEFILCPELEARLNPASTASPATEVAEAVIKVRAGALIAEKTAATKGTPGSDLFGHPLPAEDGIDQTIPFDQVIQPKEKNGQLVFTAQKDGNLRFANKTVTIADLITIDGNIDSNTGNLDHREDLQINGSVMSGFSVRSQGNIAISGSVYNGAKVFAGGDITVGEGITGAETRVVAFGNVRAIFIQESEVIVKGEARVMSYLYNAVLRANGTITVLHDERYGRKSGQVIGGLTCSSKAINASRVGHPSQAGTVLAILPDPEFSGQLKRLDDEGKNCRDSITRISRTLPFDNFDAATIKRVLAQMPAEKRDPVLKLLSTFNTLIKRQQNIDTLRKEINTKMLSSLRNGSIQVLQAICQGSELQFGEKKLVIAADQAGATFTLQGGEIV